MWSQEESEEWAVQTRQACLLVHGENEEKNNVIPVVVQCLKALIACGMEDVVQAVRGTRLVVTPVCGGSDPVVHRSIEVWG